jgi:lactate permease
MIEVWPACLVAGLSFAITQFLVSNFHGPWVVDIAAAMVSMLALVLLLRVWQPKTVWTFEHDDPTAERAGRQTYDTRQKLLAWMPWVLLSIVVFAWGLPDVKTALNGGTAAAPNVLSGVSLWSWPVPGLHQAIVRVAPVVAKPTPEAAVFTLNWLSATGTSLLLVTIASALLLGFSPLEIAKTFAHTLKRTAFSLLTIAAMMALGFSTRYGGLDATMGLAFASTGVLFPFFSPLLGWLGVALTGSDTSSNVLFGGLQQITAQQVGVSPILAAAANSSGGVMGKMIDAQSIVVAGVATGQKGGEGVILRYVFWHSIALACLVGVVVLLQAYVFPWMIPGGPH